MTVRPRMPWIAALVLLARTVVAAEPEWSGYVGLEGRLFIDDPLFDEQPAKGLSPSAVLAPELRVAGEHGNDRFTFAPFWRIDADDDQRTHVDVREALWLHTQDEWTWRVGIGRVFWGVTESRHLVDIVNQTDRVEDIDDEDKLGQSMVAVERWSEELGSFALFMLPGFRERTFPAADARLRGAMPIDTDRAEYESGAGDRHIDWAARWTHATGGWDLGASAFYGTSREPRLLPRLEAGNERVLVPRYGIIGQIGVDLQYTRNAWLWKFEGIGRWGEGDAFAAMVAGFEYTLFGIGDSGADLGVLAEYLYDDRDARAPPTIYEDDWFVGARLSFNDLSDTTLLSGAVLDSSGTLAIVEAERRLTSYWKLGFEARLLIDVDERDILLAGFRRDSFASLQLIHYF